MTLERISVCHTAIECLVPCATQSIKYVCGHEHARILGGGGGVKISMPG